MIRSILSAAAFAACAPMLAPDTGGNAGGVATLEAPPAAPPANPAAGETVTDTGTAGTAGTPAAGEKKPKRGKGAAGMSVFVSDSLAAAMTDAKARGGKFTSFTVKVPGKPDRFFVSNHRNAVQHRILTDDGYTMFSGDGSNKGGRRPADPTKRADELLAGMDEATRRALFAKYIGAGASDLAAQLPAQPPRDDTTPEFAAAQVNGAVAAPATPVSHTVPANVGSVPPVGNQPAGKVATPATPAGNGGKGTPARKR